MADEPQPKPTPRSASDKEKSRQQSRPVGKQAGSQSPGSGAKGQGSKGQPAKGQGSKGQPAKGQGAKASGGGKGGQRPPRPGGRPAPPPPARSATNLLVIGVVALVIIVVVVLVVVNVTGSNTPSSAASVPAPQSVIGPLTSIPTSVYNQVGVDSSLQVTKPTVLHGAPPLVYGGKPGAFYYGAEYCPYCATERWPLIAAMSRFGTWSGLWTMSSSSTDVYSNTQTFTFSKATLTSPYLTLKTVEQYSNIPDSSGGYQTLQNPDSEQVHLLKTYENAKYIPGIQLGDFPFVDIGNKLILASASFTPSALSDLSRSEIASNLDDPTNPVTQAIVATANYMSAGVCASTGQKPVDVCASKGVRAADKALHLTP